MLHRTGKIVNLENKWIRFMFESYRYKIEFSSKTVRVILIVQHINCQIKLCNTYNTKTEKCSTSQFYGQRHHLKIH